MSNNLEFEKFLNEHFEGRENESEPVSWKPTFSAIWNHQQKKIDSLKAQLAEAVGLMKDFNNGILQIPELSFENFIKSLEGKEGE